MYRLLFAWALALVGCAAPALDQSLAESCDGTCDNCVHPGAIAADPAGRQFECVAPGATACWSPTLEQDGASQWRCIPGTGCEHWAGNCADLEGRPGLFGELARLVDLVHRDVCARLAPLVDDPAVQRFGRAISRPAYFVSANASFGGPQSTQVSADLVWDLWSHEISVFTASSDAATLRTVGADANLLSGVAIGLDHGVRSWAGPFGGVAGGGDVFPFSPFNLQLGAGVFSSLDPATSAPNWDVVGAYLSAGVSLDLFLNLPLNLSVSRTNHWALDADANRVVAGLEGWLLAEFDGEVARFPIDEQVPDLIDLVDLAGAGPHTKAAVRSAASMLTLAPSFLAEDAAMVGIALGIVHDRGYDDVLGFYDDVCR